MEPAGGIEPDFVRTACAFAGAPYLWGGKSVRGIDCSGLVQLALLRAGIDCPRDTDMQARLLPGGVDVTDSGIDGLRRGDIVYWPGHVAIMLDASEAVHASGTLMCTGIEPIATIAERSRKGGPIVAAVKRLYDTESALIA